MTDEEQAFIEGVRQRGAMMRELHSRNAGDRPLPRFVSVEEFVAAHGKFFGENHPLPDFVKRGEIKQCFTNSSRSFMHCGGELAYVEGIAMGKKLAFPVHHAWLVDEAGRVYDPTWTYEPGEALYFGVPFSEEYFFATADREEYYGIITPGEWFNKRLIEGIDGPEEFLHPWFVKEILDS